MRRDHDMPLDPDVERELEAVDHALQGLRVATDLEDLRDLAVDARADRPALEPDFGAELDQWAAAGFPREARPGVRTEEETGSALSGLLERLRSVPPRRLLLSTGAAATFVVAVAVAIGVSDQLGGSGGAPPGASNLPHTASAGNGGAGADAARPAPHSNALPAGASEAQTLGQTQAYGQLTPDIQNRAGFMDRNQPSVVTGRAAHRKVEQNVDLVLATEPQNVRD